KPHERGGGLTMALPFRTLRSGEDSVGGDMARWIIALAAAAMTAMTAAPAAAADLVVGVYAADPDACGDARTLSRISARFDHQVRNVPHLPLVSIDNFDRVGAVRYLPAHANRPIERRYCAGRVSLSDGRSRDIFYLIENPMGFAGIGSNVEF